MSYQKGLKVINYSYLKHFQNWVQRKISNTREGLKWKQEYNTTFKRARVRNSLKECSINSQGEKEWSKNQVEIISEQI